MRIIFLRWLRVFLSGCIFCAMVFLAIFHHTTAYLLQQAAGQIHILTHTVAVEEYRKRTDLPDTVRTNLALIGKIKKYSVDSLGYKSTGSFTRVYDQNGKPVLWVVTAAPRYKVDPYEWVFPVVGKVSYKGFFEKYRAHREYIRLVSEGYDVAIRSVSAWSTLGWFNDPLLSNSLKRSKATLCNLLFHELFHATFYKAGDVNLNENLANFIADKATRKFLGNDTASLRVYDNQVNDEKVYKNFLLRQVRFLDSIYTTISPSQLEIFKKQTFRMIADSVDLLPVNNKATITRRKKDILKFQNAFFVDLRQYESLQDSLENAFNKIYGGNIKNMVQDLTTE